MKKYLFLFLLSACTCLLWGQKKADGKFAYGGFSGGMLLHSGYVWSGSFTLVNAAGQPEKRVNRGFPFGMGGMLRFRFGKHFRIGGQGYVTTLYLPKGSYCQTGWGGLLADWVWHRGKVSPFAGVSLGGGSQKLLILPSDHKNGNLSDGVLFEKYTFLLADPFIGIEIRVSGKLCLVFKADYLLNLTRWKDNFTTGPRLYFGVLFYTLSQKKTHEN
jgi:hypothetical protein